LINVAGFDPSQMLVLMDDGEHPAPTRKNIENGFERIVRYSQPGDVVFVSFSGHGGQIRDTSGDEDDGFDESIIPVDFQTAGQIVDDDILKTLVKPMAEGVHCTILMDCCHSGTGTIYRVDGENACRDEHERHSNVLLRNVCASIGCNELSAWRLEGMVPSVPI
jgi:hypothetical protein